MNLHETMLFRWMGYWIENPEDAQELATKRPLLPKGSELTSDQRRSYISVLREALDPALGLPVSDYSDLDRVGKSEPLVNPRPCLFFTEQAAVTGEEHWRKYGRLGLGFTKRSVFRRGGRPVIYTGGKNDPVQKAITSLREHFDIAEVGTHSAVCEAVELLARLVKCTHLPRQNASPAPGKPARKPKATTQEKKPPRPMKYPLENRIGFLHEREWRLLAPNKKSESWHTDPEDVLRFRPGIGTELQIAILPDNETLQMAIDCDDIRTRLIQSDRPPLQLITAELLRRV